MMVRILEDRAADVVNLEIRKLGGITKARVVQDPTPSLTPQPCAET
eukprot:CAMPEP_0194325440 /NCGR_PEP_ID=MMETSP0171-20130528/30750_1 /TAXON_ID=218684 /ORGANISM="Corethron pennatum, Strain L29A3" /LENGTH=45 /DNA_ID= /DNA_START= /DNA_END= /DNA_ORIENTATION=